MLNLAFLALLLLFPTHLWAQQMNPSQRIAYARQVKREYYALREKGFLSFDCELKVDWSTVPKPLFTPLTMVGTTELEAAKFHLSVNDRLSDSLQHEYPQKTTAAQKVAYDLLSSWLENAVQGWVMTWGSKALGGMVEDEFLVTDAETTSEGHRITVKIPRQQISFQIGKNDLVTEIRTQTDDGQQTVEHPVFQSSPEGFLLSSIDALSVQGSDQTRVHYDLDYQPVNGFQLPHQVHLAVNSNMEMRFAFETCKTEKPSIVIHLQAEPNNTAVPVKAK